MVYMGPSTANESYDPSKEQLFSTDNPFNNSGHICGIIMK